MALLVDLPCQLLQLQIIPLYFSLISCHSFPEFIQSALYFNAEVFDGLCVGEDESALVGEGSVVGVVGVVETAAAELF